MPIIYQAGPLFSEAEQLWHLALKAEIEKRAAELGKPVEVIWPYQLFDQCELQTLGPAAGPRVFQRCLEELRRSDLVVALLDGAQVDDGTAWEIGYAYALGKPILGIRTDFRQAGDCAGSLVNAMVEHSCARIFRSVEELVAGVEGYLAGKPSKDSGLTAS